MKFKFLYFLNYFCPLQNLFLDFYIDIPSSFPIATRAPYVLRARRGLGGHEPSSEGLFRIKGLRD